MSRQDRFSQAELEYLVLHQHVKTDVLARMVSRQFKTCRSEKSVGAALYRAGVRKPRPQRFRASVEQRVMHIYPPNGV